jgi:hypothetical protein
MPVMPRCDIDYARLRMSQCLPKGLLPIDRNYMLHGVPNAPCHHVPEKFISIRQRHFGRIPPYNLPSDSLKLAIPRLHGRNTIPQGSKFNVSNRIMCGLKYPRDYLIDVYD